MYTYTIMITQPEVQFTRTSRKGYISYVILNKEMDFKRGLEINTGILFKKFSKRNVKFILNGWSKQVDFLE